MTRGSNRASRWGQLVTEIVADRRLALMLALGFSAGLPFLLVFSTLSAWLREAGIARTEIGFLSYIALAYSFKFLWAPIIDRRDVPFLSRFGRRRAWMLLSQLSVSLGLIGIAFGNPSHSLVWTVACAFFVAFSSATQDVVVDGWRIGAAPIERQGMMSASYQLGYRIALLCAGAGALYIADFGGWKAAYITMAMLMAVGITASMLAPHPPQTEQKRTARILSQALCRAGCRSHSAQRGDDHPHSRARCDLSRSRFRLRRDGEPALYRSRFLENRHRHRDQTLRRLDRHRLAFLRAASPCSGLG